METKVYRFENDDFSENDIEALTEAGNILKAGGLVAFPTETVYGLGGDALNKDSSKKIYAAKGRPSDNPLIVHICKWEDIYKIAAEVPKEAEKLAERFWPGPLTMILKKAECVPYETTGGLDTVAIRFPSHPLAQKMIEKAGGYVAAPSANTSGKPSPTLAKYVEEDMMGKIDMILDGGQEVGIGLESTIIDLTTSPAMILRPGYITTEMFRQVLGEVDTDRTILDANTKQAPKAPGMKYRHYAPKGDLTIVEGEALAVAEYINEKAKEHRRENKKIGIIVTSESLALYDGNCIDEMKCVGSRNDEEEIARNLYNFLREFDDESVEVIFSESFETGGLGQAIMNRLLKAAGHKVIHLDSEQ